VLFPLAVSIAVPVAVPITVSVTVPVAVSFTVSVTISITISVAVGILMVLPPSLFASISLQGLFVRNVLLRVVPDRGGMTWVLKAVNGGREDDKNDKGKDNGLYCQHC